MNAEKPSTAPTDPTESDAAENLRAAILALVEREFRLRRQNRPTVRPLPYPCELPLRVP